MDRYPPIDYAPFSPRVPYPDSSSIDWTLEYAKERSRLAALARRTGVRGALSRLVDSALPWLVVVATGVTVGLLAASMDVVTAWLADLRSGVCRDQWWMSRRSCCTGLDAGEICNAWKTWGDVAGQESVHVVVRSLTQYSLYILLAVVFAVTSSFFVQIYAPHAFHTGIPEIKTVLGGYIIVDFLSGWTLLIKSLGLPLAVASGLSLGKEGPLVHVATCVGNIFLQPFAVLKGNEARQREILSAAAAAGISVAFGAPLGAVLFALEEISTYFHGNALWQSFVCSIVAAVTLQYIDPFSTGSLALFRVTASQVWRGFEFIPWLFLGVLGGLWGAFFVRINEGWERFRRSSGLGDWPVTEVAALALFTAVVSYLMVFTRITSSELVASLFQDCSEGDPYRLCEASTTSTTIFLLLVTAAVKTLLTAVTFGASIPAGIFLPSLTIGACVGRAVGIGIAAVQRSHPTAWIFSSACPTDGPCVNPSVYAVIGAAAALGGVTRMTISLVVILLELTGAVDLVLQIMMAVMVSKFTGDFFSKSGIYETWINIREYPFLNNKLSYRRDTVLAKDIMTKVQHIIYLVEGWSIERIESLLETEEYRGFPIVRSLADRIVIGYISRNDLHSAISQARSHEDVQSLTPCYFTDSSTRGRQVGPRATDLFEADIKEPLTPAGVESGSGEPGGDGPGGQTRDGGWFNLRPWVDQTPIMFSLDTPIELVLQMVQRLGLRFVLLTKHGALVGILTKMDLHSHVQPDKDAGPAVARQMSKSNVANLGLRSRRSSYGGAETPVGTDGVQGEGAPFLSGSRRQDSIDWGI